MFFKSSKTSETSNPKTSATGFTAFTGLEKHFFSPESLPFQLSSERIRLARERFHPAPPGADVCAENIEMHDSALFDDLVEIDFYDGRRLRIPQCSTPAGWEAVF